MMHSFTLICVQLTPMTLQQIFLNAGPFVHHFLISVVLELFVPSSTKNDFTYRNLDKIDLESFYNSLNSFDWSNVTNMSNVNDVLIEIVTNIQTTLNIHAPLITISSNRKFEPLIAAPEQYRTISILYVISKIFQNIIAEVIMNFLTIYVVVIGYSTA